MNIKEITERVFLQFSLSIWSYKFQWEKTLPMQTLKNGRLKPSSQSSNILDHLKHQERYADFSINLYTNKPNCRSCSTALPNFVGQFSRTDLQSSFLFTQTKEHTWILTVAAIWGDVYFIQYFQGVWLQFRWRLIKCGINCGNTVSCNIITRIKNNIPHFSLVSTVTHNESSFFLEIAYISY